VTGSQKTGCLHITCKFYGLMIEIYITEFQRKFTKFADRALIFTITWKDDSMLLIIIVSIRSVHKRREKAEATSDK